jgi:hypothetical protein
LIRILPLLLRAAVVFEVHNVTATLEQVVKADSLRFGSIEATNVNSKLRLQARQVFFGDARAETYGGSATGKLFFYLSGKNPSFRADARISRVDMEHD